MVTEWEDMRNVMQQACPVQIGFRAIKGRKSSPMNASQPLPAILLFLPWIHTQSLEDRDGVYPLVNNSVTTTTIESQPATGEANAKP